MKYISQKVDSLETRTLIRRDGDYEGFVVFANTTARGRDAIVCCRVLGLEALAFYGQHEKRTCGTSTFLYSYQ